MQTIIWGEYNVLSRCSEKRKKKYDLLDVLESFLWKLKRFSGRLAILFKKKNNKNYCKKLREFYRISM